MSSLINQIIHDLEKGLPFTIATIISHHGSTPRSAGAAMIIRADGTIAGTVGGGQIEAKTIELARTVLEEKRPIRKEFYFTGKDAATSDMICGGNQEVLVEYLDPKDEIWLRQNKSLAEAAKNRKRAWSIVHLPDRTGASGSYFHMVVFADGSFDTPIEGVSQVVQPTAGSGGFPSLVISGQVINLADIRSTRVIDRPDGQYLINPVDQNGTVYLFGGGHVSLQVAIAAKMVGFRVVVMDDRAEFVSTERFPMADEVLLIPAFDHCFDSLQLDPGSYLVILTRGHLHDQIVLEQALNSSADYIGMIGSQKKCLATFEALRQKGYSDEKLKEVYAPIGLKIDAETPEEIAISITAELIQVRAALLK